MPFERWAEHKILEDLIVVLIILAIGLYFFPNATRNILGASVAVAKATGSVLLDLFTGAL